MQRTGRQNYISLLVLTHVLVEGPQITCTNVACWDPMMSHLMSQHCPVTLSKSAHNMLLLCVLGWLQGDV